MGKHFTDQAFTELDLDQRLLDGLQAANFEFCTPIQAESLPAALANKDVIGQAQTGTGKTLAFLLATMNHLLRKEPVENRVATQPRAVMLAPTRELAIQIHKDALSIGGECGMKIELVYGGTGYEQQRKALEAGVDILIGTPGRLIDYFKQGVFNLQAVDVMVLDEADRMFDLGFIKDLRYLLRHMPPAAERLNLLFSATMSFRVLELTYEHMDDPQVIKIEIDKVVVDEVTESIYYPANEEKIPLLLTLLKKVGVKRSLVFINTKHMAETIGLWLEANEVNCGILSGDVPQNKREKLLERFKTDDIDVLVATDVAARGLHIPEVSHVFNFDLPQDAEDYVHRIGRTARAGASGDAISFACERYSYSLMDIEEYVGHPLPKKDITPDLLFDMQKPTEEARRKSREAPRAGDRQRGGDKRAGRVSSGHDQKDHRRRDNRPHAKKESEESDVMPEKRETRQPKEIKQVETPAASRPRLPANDTRVWDRFGQEIPAVG